MVLDLQALAVSAVGGLSAGFVVGWALRRVLSVLEYVAALVVLLFGGAAMLGIITINLDAAARWIAWLAEKVFGAVTPDTVAGALSSLGLPFLVGFAVGVSRPQRGAAPVLLAAALEESEWVE